jgi:hypothetical protein
VSVSAGKQQGDLTSNLEDKRNEIIAAVRTSEEHDIRLLNMLDDARERTEKRFEEAESHVQRHKDHLKTVQQMLAGLVGWEGLTNCHKIEHFLAWKMGICDEELVDLKEELIDERKGYKKQALEVIETSRQENEKFATRTANLKRLVLARGLGLGASVTALEEELDEIFESQEKVKKSWSAW